MSDFTVDYPSIKLRYLVKKAINNVKNQNDELDVRIKYAKREREETWGKLSWWKRNWNYSGNIEQVPCGIDFWNGEFKLQKRKELISGFEKILLACDHTDTVRLTGDTLKSLDSWANAT